MALVKLDRGQAVDTWHIGGSFQTRDEQSAVARDLAREWGIPIFDMSHNEQRRPLEGGKFLAKITGVIPEGMSLPAAPVQTKEFPTQAEATEWLLSEALSGLPTPVHSVEVFSADGKSVWREKHWSHDAIKAKNEKWWDERDPGRKAREKEQAERRRKIASGEISGDQLWLAVKFQLENPAWTGPHFASMPVQTIDRGWIWLSQYWERPHTGLRYASKSWFPDE